MSGALSNRRVAVLAADGFEKVELPVPVAAMKAAGATVETISLRPGRIRGVNLHQPAGRVRVDLRGGKDIPAIEHVGQHPAHLKYQPLDS